MKIPFRKDRDILLYHRGGDPPLFPGKNICYNVHIKQKGGMAVAVSSRRQNDKLDLFKCIAIYAVIMAHIPFPGQFGRAICALAKFSVVLFFMVSGYFSWGAGSKSLAKRGWKTLKMLVQVCLALLLFGCVLTAKSGGSVAAYLLGRLHPLYLKELLLYQMVPLP